MCFNVVICVFVQLQQKKAEVAGALEVLHEWALAAGNQSRSHCQTLLLKKLEHHITTCLLIVNQLQIQVIQSNPNI